MATRRYGLSRGERKGAVAEAAGAATVADDFELTVDFASGATREEVLLALDTLKGHILESDWPPA